MYETKKVSKIVDEILTYLLDKGADNIEIKVEKKDEYTLINTTSQNIFLKDSQLDELKTFLNTTHREQEVEEYYWSLAGEGRFSHELSLVAVMVDIAEIYYKGNILVMNLVRKNINR